MRRAIDKARRFDHKPRDVSRSPRAGRGLNWHNRIEPYLPHRLSGFVLFAWRYLPNRDDPRLVIDDDDED